MSSQLIFKEDFDHIQLPKNKERCEGLLIAFVIMFLGSMDGDVGNVSLVIPPGH